MSETGSAKAPPFAAWVSADAGGCFAEAVDGVQPAPGLDIAGLRTHYRVFNQRQLDEALSLYPVEIDQDTIAGVAVHVVRRAGAAALAAGDPVLICLHGGAFMWGEGPGALLEAVPVAAVAKITVIAVEYRMAPEHVFPAAVDDVVAVYRALCADRPASRIGLYGCSAGAALTAQAVARLLADGVPGPGAVAMLCAAGLPLDGDSAATAAWLNGLPSEAGSVDFAGLPYFAGIDRTDPLVFPGEHDSVLAGFPPSLLISGTRDFAASSVSVMHRYLLRAGVAAECVIFDGMWHAHHMATGLPESRETFDLLARFFTARLAA